MKAPPLWATLFTLLGIAILCGLGYWQLERLDWKTRLIAAIEQAYATDPMAFELTRENLARLPQQQDFVRGFAEGSYLHQHEILLGPRTYEGKTGYHVITPFDTGNKEILFINRGWVPANEEFARPSGRSVITGTARRPGRDNRFVPENRPSGDKWFRLDLGQMARARGLKNVLPFILYADETASSGAYPLAKALKWQPRNNHLSYAIFWFSMAGALALIYGLRFLRKDEKN